MTVEELVVYDHMKVINGYGFYVSMSPKIVENSKEVRFCLFSGGHGNITVTSISIQI